jgi:hypothetical protein
MANKKVTGSSLRAQRSNLTTVEEIASGEKPSQ